MTIKELRILPPFAIGRLGGADEPQDNYTIEEDPEHPLGFRRIVGQDTLVVDDESGEIRESRTPARVTFTKDGRIKPVAPFLEVFAVTNDDSLVPLTTDLLTRAGVRAGDVRWRVRVANRKVARRTGDDDDVVAAETGWFSDHDPHRLEGRCANFVRNGTIDFGHVRFIKPNARYPQIRLRFTPAQGLIYGPRPANTVPDVPAAGLTAEDRDIDRSIPPSRRIYDRKKGRWAGFTVGNDERPEPGSPFQDETLPPSLYAIVPPAPSWLYDNVAVSRGYLDDACDGFVEVSVRLPNRKTLEASARITASPPALVPDSLFVRSLADDLDQIIHGPHVPDDEPAGVTRGRAEDIVRRAYETVRFMNLVVLNGNAFDGRDPLTLDSMPEEESADTERAIRPIMSPMSVDTRAVLALHEQVFAALRAGAAPWFADLLRKPDEVADYTDKGRRKMPALMCAADNSYLALTWRQINTIIRAATAASGLPAPADPAGQAGMPPSPRQLTPRNRSAQVHYAAAGNPISSRPVTSVANCCPGLEVDFRAVWRRLFEGIVLREYDNLVMDVEPGVKDKRKRGLKGHRLLRVEVRHADGRIEKMPMMTPMKGPATSDTDGAILLTTNLNPDGQAPLEWSNALAHVLAGHMGRTVKCDFSDDKCWGEQRAVVEDPPNYFTLEFRIRPFWEGDTAVISRALAEAGELTQGLCSPWQNDYRECSCYYWASARPDFVNVEVSSTGLSVGDNFFQKERTGQYVVDDYLDQRLVMYDDLFENWEKWLRFQIGGRDIPPDEA